MIFNLKALSCEETEKIGTRLAEELEKCGISRAYIALLGEMGVGKTAFSRGFCRHFGINSVKSPTYTVLNEYRGRCNIHHFDFYRITGEEDLYSIGYDDIIEGGGYVLGEWVENIRDFLPDDAIYVTISRVGFDTSAENERCITIRLPDSEVLGKINFS